MTADDRTVQVPVSLIEQAERFDRRGGLGYEVHEWLRELRTLLSQPTPTAEPCKRCAGTGYIASPPMPDVVDLPCPNCSDAEPQPLNPEAVQRVLDYHGWPPRIEDMAPGTTFTGKFIPGGERRTFQRTTGSWPVRTLGTRIGYRAEDILPSTIRDVTPPKETP